MAGRKVVDEREARALLARMSRSKIEASKWARLQGIDGRSLTAWRLIIERKRRNGSSSSRPRRRAERALQLVELVPTEVMASPAPARYALKLAGAVVEFGDDASAETLRRVVEALRSC